METSIAEVESPQETGQEQFSIEQASTDELRSALGITQEPQAQDPEPVAEEQIPETQAVEPMPQAESQEPEVESQEEAEEAEEAEDEKLGKRRIRPRNELDQQVIDLYRSEGFSGSFADASRVIYGQETAPTPNSNQNLTPTQDEVEANEPDPIAGIDQQADDIRATILELEGKVEKAAEDLETTEALRLQRDIMKQELQLQNLTLRKQQMEQEREQQVYQTHRSKAMESRDRVYDRYPALSDKQSVYRKQFDDYVANAQSDPDYAAVFNSPKWPELLANEFASIVPAPQEAPQPQAVAPQPQAPQMGTQAKVLTTGTAAQPVNTPVTREGLLQQVPTMSNNDLYALLGNPGGAQPLR
jgi:hypothetical protein